MSTLRKIAATSLIALTLAVGSMASITPALAHGGGGGGHGGGGHEGGFGMSSSHFGGGGNRSFGGDHFAGRFRDHRPFFFGDDDDYYYDQCQWQWTRNSLGHPVRIEVCY
ncbi:hypothetical protein [Rhizobium sp. BK251]|uniref:hypothetical protein n=1 Tax=Rhizobium sp. BK251 TaxID=2512125 RepID=UPI00104A2B21|nr:hypothetical protein [Rhizobium sp. BK251]TCL71079.1 hypothetical protein EV286_10652 [Rhizobium sp. BK251]